MFWLEYQNSWHSKRRGISLTHFLNHSSNLVCLSGCFVLINDTIIQTINDRLDQRALQIVYNGYESSFEQLLLKDKFFFFAVINNIIIG